MDCLKHRGPDRQKFSISPDRRVALGHTRLSIININYGNQPIANQDGNIHIIANGKFYDFERIQCDLRRWGYKLKTNSDSEIALHLSNEFGIQCLHHLRGKFAFVIWDERNELLFAARDRFGIKPLYYSNYRNTLYMVVSQILLSDKQLECYQRKFSSLTLPFLRHNPRIPIPSVRIFSRLRHQAGGGSRSVPSVSLCVRSYRLPQALHR